MMDHPTLPLIIGLLVVLFAAWLVTGGPAKEESTAGKFIKPTSPLDSGQIYDEKLIDKEIFIESLLEN